MPRPHAPPPLTTEPRSRWHYLLAAAACGATTLLTLPLHDWLEPVNAVMLFLLTVVLVAARLGRGPAVMASFLSVGLFDFFYVPPRFSFAVSDIQYLLTLAVMLTVALIIGQLAIGMRQRADEAQQAARRAQALHALAHQLAGALTAEQVLHHLQAFMLDQLGADLHLWQPGLDNGLILLHGEGTVTPAPTPSLILLARAIAQDSAHPHAHHVQDDQGSEIESPDLHFGRVHVDFVRRQVLRDDAPVHLTPIEYHLLCVLLAHAGKVMTHRQLLKEVWGPAYADSAHDLRIYVGHLRHKLEDDPAQPRHFLTEVGVGYRFISGD